MALTSCTRAVGTPRRRAASTWNRRSGVGTAQRRTSSSVSRASQACSPGSALSPYRPVSNDRMAFWSDSVNVRPIAMASPTDCIWVPRTPGASGNFSNAHRGTLVTT